MSGFRLSRGGRIDRAKRLAFEWDGSQHYGYQGDTLASALLANGERILGRSFKYHRPRGVMSAGVEESGALVHLWRGARRIPNAKATQVELIQGLEAFGQNAWPNVRIDVGAVNSLMGRFFGAGFYYKTFMGVLGRQTWEWMFFEKIIRRAAGMGSASKEPDPDHYEIVNDHCDVAVIGSGPAGLAAAETAAQAGLDVVLIEQDFALGGSLLSNVADTVEGDTVEDWQAGRLAGLSSKGGRVWNRTTAFGLYDHGVVGCLERVTDHMVDPHHAIPRERMRILRARRVIMATGALERPIAFGDNDRPGVMLGHAVRTYAERFGVAAGRRIVYAACNDEAYDDAASVAEKGLEVTLLDPREVVPDHLAAMADEAGVRLLKGYVPVEAHGRRGVTGLMIGRHLGGGKARSEREIGCDTIAVSGGWNPAVHLLSHRGVRPVWSDRHLAFLPGDAGREPIHVAGSAAGVPDTEGAALSGRAVAEAALRALGKGGAKSRKAPAACPAGETQPIYEVRVKAPKLKSFVDPQNDVTADDVRLAEREGYVSVEHLKRYTTLGMSTDQGKIGNVIGMALMAEATGKTIPETGTTTFRPPYTPISMGAVAGTERGTHWRPTRRTPMHAAHEKLGGKFVDAGAWKRSWYYPKTGENLTTASMREARIVRDTVGMVDVSTLGKIQVQGPDAAEFLNRVYSNAFAKLPVGKARYGLMLRVDGVVFDDGTTWRLSETEFFMTTTTANAGPVMLHLANLLQTWWPDLRVHISSVSDHWGGVAVAGPKARDVLMDAFEGIDFADQAFPFMGVREGMLKVAGGGTVPARVARLSFSGERAWEVFCPADYCPAMWETLLRKVQAAGGVPYGLEALDILRVEKGHVTARELDGRTTATDCALGGMESKKKSYIGSVLKEREHLTRRDRPTLVGLRPVTEGEQMKAGSILCAQGEVVGDGLGWVSSIADSPVMGERIGLGFVRGGLTQWDGKTILAESPVDGKSVEVKVVSPHFFDPDGGRMHG